MKLRKILVYLAMGIAWGCTFFVVNGMIGTAIKGPSFLVPVINNFIPQALGAMLVGICCGSTAIIYREDRLSLGQQVTIHFVVGLGGYFGVAWKLGWLPIQNPRWLLSSIIIGIAVFVVIWTGFYLVHKKEAEQMNQKLKLMEDAVTERKAKKAD